MDLRYPRPGWVKVLRFALRFWWLLPASFAWTVFFNFLSLAADPRQTMHGADVQRALMVGWLFALWSDGPVRGILVTAPLVGIAAILVWLGALANRDYQEEQTAMLERRILQKMSTLLP
jgi:hypothetical protein